MNFYKISTIVLLIALITVIFFFINKQKNQQAFYLTDKGKKVFITKKDIKDLFSFNDLLDLDPRFVDKLDSANNSIDSVKTGKPLTLRTAGQNWRSFKKWNTKRGNFIREIKPNGFAFGKYRIRRMLYKIDSMNRKITERGNLDSLIVGVRLNLSHTVDPLNPRAKPSIDALFTPIKANGNSFYDIETEIKTATLDGTNEMLLNTSVPCPNNCHGD